MKQIGIVIVLVIVALGAWIFMAEDRTTPNDRVATKSNTASSTHDDPPKSAKAKMKSVGSSGGVTFNETQEEDWSDFSDEPIQPATELYQSYDQAIAAVKKAAAEYDDIVIEQFVELGPECTWCGELYSEISRLMLAAEPDSDEKSYYAEMLALSGRPELVETILDEMKKLEDGTPDFDLYADALEMTIGGDGVVEVLAKNLDTENEELKESILAAISNQGSAFAIDLLYKHTKESGTEDGYYSVGVGLGEVIPDREAYPLMREIVSNRDQYSHLAVKGLLNAGVEGLQVVFEILDGSTDLESDKKLLEGAVDHVTYEDETEKYLREVVSKSSNPALVEFAKESLEYLSEESEE
jgi:hypothetical protein